MAGLSSVTPRPSAGPAALARLPRAPGVYRFRDASARVLYVGRATSLRSRASSYWSDLRDRGHLAAMVARVAAVEAVVCDSVHEAAWLERNLLEAALPRWNKTPGGQEVPVRIRLDARPDRPRLTIERAGPLTGDGEWFGPYLGRQRVRLAVRGLGRCLPLAASGTGLRGVELSLARARGVSGADFGYLVETVRAVLLRQPDAAGLVRDGLRRLREQAAAALAFEQAADIQRELQALDWVTCPQRATTLEPASFTACGWSGGVATRLIVRGGKLSTWRQTRCPRSAVVADLAATPPDWAAFAQRNADLAAALSQPAGTG